MGPPLHRAGVPEQRSHLQRLEPGGPRGITMSSVRYESLPGRACVGIRGAPGKEKGFLLMWGLMDD